MAGELLSHVNWILGHPELVADASLEEVAALGELAERVAPRVYSRRKLEEDNAALRAQLADASWSLNLVKLWRMIFDGRSAKA